MTRAASWGAWVWRELTRERALPRRRAVARHGRSSRAGIALLMAVSIIAILTVMVTEVVHAASVRIQLAGAQRDEAKAEALASGGIQFYRLLLIASKQLEGNPMIEQAGLLLGINADSLWQVIPSVSSSLLRMLLVTDGDEDEARKIQNRGGLTDAQIAQSREISSQTNLKKAFLDFDGDFTASVFDEDQQIYIGDLRGPTLVDLQSSPHGILLGGMFFGEDEQEWLRDENLDKWELIANLADWTDADDDRIYLGGRESALYEDLPDPYLPKNQAFDTVQEIRLVAGWERDYVWQKYGRFLTIYGGKKVNVNTARQRVLKALLASYIQPPPTEDSMDLIIDMIQAFRNTLPMLGEGGVFRQGAQFVEFVQQYAPGTVDPAMKNAITTKSRVFRVTSKGEVGRATVEIEAVFDFDKNPSGKVLYWHIE
ncbi:MAG: general secretion pathway protein GspK [Alphaproteobacteria bacterium]|nr:general secretion pathway protein GspK [Alphaproteobacteria bacterium]